MGMLFNTSETTALLNKSNAAFSGQNFAALRTNPPANFSTVHLGTAHRRKIYTHICAPLNITSRHPKRWAFWLDLLDNTLDQTGQHYLAELIGNGIGDALANNSFDAVEFFIVPASSRQPSLSLAISDIQDAAQPGRLIKVITIYTALVDSFPHAPAPGT